jgi:hypothetical protein
MSGNAAEKLYSAIEESAGLLDVPCSRENVWPILSAFEEALPQAAILFRVATDVRHAGEMNCHFMMLPGDVDPYALAVSKGLIKATEHPVGALVADLAERFPVGSYGIDFGVVGGFQKLYASFPRTLRKVSDLAGLPSMPPAVAAHADYFARHGLDDVAVIGVDYKRGTMNLYFQLPTGTAGDLAAEAVSAMLRESGMPEPDPRLLEFARGSYRVYTTFSWDSPAIERISFAPKPRRGMDMSIIEGRMEPLVQEFLAKAPYAYDGERITISVPKWTAGGGHLNVGTYYQVSPQLGAQAAAPQQDG